MMRIALVNGSKYFAGANRPFFLTRGTVNGWLAKFGFVNPKWHDRSESPPVDPRKDPKYSDDWDEWVEVDYQGPASSVEPPADPAWLIVLLPSVATSQAPQTVVGSSWAAPTPQTTSAPTLAPRETSVGSSGVGAAVFAFGVLTVLGGTVAALLRKRR